MKNLAVDRHVDCICTRGDFSDHRRAVDEQRVRRVSNPPAIYRARNPVDLDHVARLACGMDLHPMRGCAMLDQVGHDYLSASRRAVSFQLERGGDAGCADTTRELRSISRCRCAMAAATRAA